MVERIAAKEVVPAHEAGRICPNRGLVPHVRVRLSRRVDEWVDRQELGGGWVVVAGSQVHKPRARVGPVARVSNRCVGGSGVVGAVAVGVVLGGADDRP